KMEGHAVVFGGPVVVREDQHLNALVVFDGPTRVDGTVAGDVVALDGDVDVAGEVGGDLVALDGAVRLERTARIGGDVRAAEGAVLADGAEVSGTIATVEAERAG